MYQLVLQFPAEGISPYDEGIRLEDLLIEGLTDGSDVDGHDFDSGETNIFILTEDAARTFKVVRELLANHPAMAYLSAGFRQV